jgi:hypothetical protein
MPSKLPKPAKLLKGVAGLFSLTGMFRPVLAHLRIRVDKLADVFSKLITNFRRFKGRN